MRAGPLSVGARRAERAAVLFFVADVRAGAFFFGAGVFRLAM
jgi:hypothetical protein